MADDLATAAADYNETAREAWLEAGRALAARASDGEDLGSQSVGLVVAAVLALAHETAQAMPKGAALADAVDFVNPIYPDYMSQGEIEKLQEAAKTDPEEAQRHEEILAIQRLDVINQPGGGELYDFGQSLSVLVASTPPERHSILMAIGLDAALRETRLLAQGEPVPEGEFLLDEATLRQTEKPGPAGFPSVVKLGEFFAFRTNEAAMAADGYQGLDSAALRQGIIEGCSGFHLVRSFAASEVDPGVASSPDARPAPAQTGGRGPNREAGFHLSRKGRYSNPVAFFFASEIESASGYKVCPDQIVPDTEVPAKVASEPVDAVAKLEARRKPSPPAEPLKPVGPGA